MILNDILLLIEIYEKCVPCSGYGFRNFGTEYEHVKMSFDS